MEVAPGSTTASTTVSAEDLAELDVLVNALWSAVQRLRDPSLRSYVERLQHIRLRLNGV